jgi:sugar lactone lactonase YvrE
MLRIELLIDAHAELGEGPLWDVAEQRFYWIDSLGSKVHSCDARGGSAQTWIVPEHIGSMALREKGEQSSPCGMASMRSTLAKGHAASSRIPIQANPASG